MTNQFRIFNLKIKNQSKRGFTLIELLVTATIILVLAGVVLVNLDRSKAKSRDVERKASLSRYAQALETFKIDKKKYPTYINCADNGLFVDIDSGAANAEGITGKSVAQYLVDFGYIEKIIADPRDSNNKFKYKTDSSGSDFKLVIKSETIKSTDGDCTNQKVKTIAGDFCNPYANYFNFQISTSEVSLRW